MQNSFSDPLDLDKRRTHRHLPPGSGMWSQLHKQAGAKMQSECMTKKHEDLRS